MPNFTVSEVVDGDAFKVKGGWEWKEKGKKGDTVWLTGYNTPEVREPGYGQARQRLEDLILGKEVDIRNPRTVDEWGRLVADVYPVRKITSNGVYYNGKNLADYFPEYKDFEISTNIF